MGWNKMEANHCFPEKKDGCDPSKYVSALWEYPHSVGQSVTGGVVLLNKGKNHGRYIFGDFTSGKIWSMELPSKKAYQSPLKSQPELLGTFPILPVAFGRDAQGEVYVADFKGELFKIVH